MANSVDALVIGAGINGASIAYNLAKRGYNVAIVERFSQQRHRDFEQMQKRATQIQGFASTDRVSRLSIAVDGHAEVGQGDFVSSTYFQVLGVLPVLGQLLPDETGRVPAPVAVVSHRYWQRRFG